jgi:hypothetical protein
MNKRPSLLLFALLLVVGIAMPVIAQTATPTTQPLPTTQATFTTIPTQAAFATPVRTVTATPVRPLVCPTPGVLKPGDFVFLRPGVYVRNLPTLSGGQVNYFTESVTLRILEGPVCADGYNWWRVQAPGNDGWVAEVGPDGRLFLFPAPTPTGIFCESPLQLQVGGKVRLITGSRVREQPDINSLVLHVAPGDVLLDIIDGPVCDKAINWWKVRVVYQSITFDGWIAEGVDDNYFVEPEIITATPEPCNPLQRRLEPGQRAYLRFDPNTGPKNLRTEPNIAAPVVVTLLDGIAFEIIGGPVCSTGYNWWQISILSRPDVTGWLADAGNMIVRLDSTFPVDSAPSPTPATPEG